MKHNTPSHVYRAQDMNRVIAQFTSKPPEQMKQKIRESLVQQKDRFLVLEQMRSRQQTQQRGRSR